MTGDSRMNLAGVMPQNAAYLAEAIAVELGAGSDLTPRAAPAARS